MLNLDTGSFTYSNAGHNPPLHFRAETELFEELKTDGIVLGAFEDIQLEEKTTLIARGDILVFYTDLIIQDGKPHDEEKKLFSTSLKNICKKHDHNFEEHNAFAAGRGLLGGNAGECGVLNFFEEKDIPFLEELIKETLPAYRKILESKKNDLPQKEDYEQADRSRARLIEWIIVEDTGIKIARENGISLEVVEAYGFPPVIRY